MRPFTKHAGGKNFKPKAAQSKNAKGGKPASLKNQIRAVERLLRKPELDIKMRARQEAKLQELRVMQSEQQHKELERKYAVRYHKVRFFERVKLERRLQKLQSQLAAAASDRPEPGAEQPLAAQLQEQIAALQADLQYVLHFPKAEKYVSLLRQADDPAAQATLEAERARLRVLVRQQLAQAAMLADADEGAALVKGPAAAALAGTSQATEQAGQAAVPESEEEDDFFLSSGDEGPEEPGQEPKVQHPAAPAAAIAAADTKRPRSLEAGGDGEGSNHESSGSGKKNKLLGANWQNEGPALAAHVGQKQQQSSGNTRQHKVGQQHPKGDHHQQQQRKQQSSQPWEPKGAPKQQQGHPQQQLVARQQQRSTKPGQHEQGGGRVPASPAGRPTAKPDEAPVQPLRSRAEGGRKRRKK